jgi:hypothetical protein
LRNWRKVGEKKLKSGKIIRFVSHFNKIEEFTNCVVSLSYHRVLVERREAIERVCPVSFSTERMVVGIGLAVSDHPNVGIDKSPIR